MMAEGLASCPVQQPQTIAGRLEQPLALLEAGNRSILSDPCARGGLICPLLSGPISILELATTEEWNGEEAQAGRYHREAA
jgi:hypothetical protein